MSLLTICQNAAAEIGFPQPSSIISNSDKNAQQLLRLANKEGKSLAADHAWQVLIKEATVTLVTADQDYALPSDFGWIIPVTTWNRDTDRMVLNPISSQEWQYLKGVSTSFGLNLRARIQGNELVFEQTITAGENNQSVVYEYVSKNWADVVATGSTKSSFTIDTDITLLDEEVMTQGVVWRFKYAKGLPFEADFQLYQKLKKQAMARDGGAKRIRMGHKLTLGVNIPETNFG